METYKYDVLCTNCKNKIDIDIPKGTLIKDYLKDLRCVNCGCHVSERGTIPQVSFKDYPHEVYHYYHIPMQIPSAPKPPIWEITC